MTSHRVLCSLAAAALLLGPANVLAQQKGKKYALLVGVREYKHNKLPDLKHTENDVEELARILQGKGAAFAEVVVLTTARGADKDELKPTAENFRKQLKRLVDRATKHDLVLIALAGHGLQMTVTDPDTKKNKDESFFCPADARPRDTKDFAELKKTMIPLGELYKELDDSGAGTKLVLVDACRNEVKLDKDVKARSTVNADTTPRPPQGTAVLFSCKGGEQAFETSKLGKKGHGVFFHYVIQGLKGEAKNRDGKVTWNGLSEYVTTKVPLEVPKLMGGGAEQTPQEVKNVVGPPPVLLELKGDEQAEKDYRKGMDVSLGVNVEKVDYAEAVKHLKKAAEGDHALAKVALAIMTAYGRGVAPDEDKAEKLIRSALARVKKLADDGDGEANNLLGVLYHDGLGVPRDEGEAFKRVRKAAEAGVPVGMSNLAGCYANGVGTEKDDEAAANWYRKAAEKGQPSAMANLGLLYVNGTGVTKDEEAGVKWIRKAAAKEEPYALTALGYCYSVGKGVGKDEKEGVRLTRKAVELNEPMAMVNLGWAYLIGQGVERDDKQAVKHFRRAVECRSVAGMAALGLAYLRGWGVEPSEERALSWLRKAADRGAADGLEYLGTMYEFGLGGLEKSPKEALKRYRRSADLGWGSSMVRLGWAYTLGTLGLERNPKEGVKWFRNAAETGQAEGMSALGDAYLQGRGVGQDFDEALKWSSKAAGLGDALGIHNVAWCHDNGKGGLKEDPATAFKLYQKSAALGQAMSHNNLGLLYCKGRGVKADNAQAFKHFKIAAEKGVATSQAALALMYETGQGTEKNAQLALFWYKKAAAQGNPDAKKRMQALGKDA